MTRRLSKKNAWKAASAAILVPPVTLRVNPAPFLSNSPQSAAVVSKSYADVSCISTRIPCGCTTFLSRSARSRISGETRKIARAGFSISSGRRLGMGWVEIRQTWVVAVMGSRPCFLDGRQLQFPQEIQSPADGDLSGHSLLAKMPHHLYRLQPVLFMEIKQ